MRMEQAKALGEALRSYKDITVSSVSSHQRPISLPTRGTRTTYTETL
jgi:hypothetical protein